MPNVVWVTGAGSGIGEAMARAFAAKGHAVALTARTRDALDAVATAIAEETPGARTLICAGDVTDRRRMDDIARDVAVWGNGLHILCNNAGLNIPRRRWDELDTDADWDDWNAVVDINIKGAMNVIAAALPIMRAQKRGQMIHTSSWAGRHHSAVSGAIYGASKHALCDLSASLNDQEGAHGIRSTALCPAEVATPLMTRRPGYDPAKAAAMIQPEDIAQTALYVAAMNPGVVVHEVVLAPVRP